MPPYPELRATKLFDVSGLVAVVTGGGTGLGLMMATALENNGAIVYVLGRRLDVLEKAATENSKHGNIIAIQCDITARESLLNAVELIKQQRGYIDLLINNAGVARHTLPQVATETSSDVTLFQQSLWNIGSVEDWATTFTTNVTAVYYTTVAFLELLHLGNARNTKSPGAPSSQVVTVGSVAAFRRDARTLSLSYGLSKSAVTHLAKTLANVLLPWNIRSNVIAPGIYPSEMTASLVNWDNISAEVVPMRRAGSIDDMGGLILFLASRAGAYVNGGVHLTDGGRLGLFASTF
ncbi:NAD-binding protein [Rickenella mellea]|uniref:NAD-binding protein n=1 Tax=Rickenella mellea TaxID=50990 RepID=A0A4Y7PYK2_9AGAM|nr:NAD-binding protein [Rickenella mellea]